MISHSEQTTGSRWSLSTPALCHHGLLHSPPQLGTLQPRDQQSLQTESRKARGLDVSCAKRPAPSARGSGSETAAVDLPKLPHTPGTQRLRAHTGLMYSQERQRGPRHLSLPAEQKALLKGTWRQGLLVSPEPWALSVRPSTHGPETGGHLNMRVKA